MPVADGVYLKWVVTDGKPIFWAKNNKESLENDNRLIDLLLKLKAFAGKSIFG